MSRVTLASASFLSSGGDLPEQQQPHKGGEHLEGCGEGVDSSLLGSISPAACQSLCLPPSGQ